MQDPGGPTTEHPGTLIRRAREAQGLSQAELGRRSGLGVRTVRRLEAGVGTPEGRTVAALRRTLGLPVDGNPVDPIAILRDIPTPDLIAEVSRRLLSADELARGQRLRLGELPPDVPGKPGTLRGPDTVAQQAESDD